MGVQNNHRVVFKNLLLTFMLIFLLLLSLMCTLGYLNAAVQPKGVITITSSGAVTGTDKIRQNGNVYTLTEDIAGGVAMGSVFINIECSGIVFDGAGKTIRGTNSGVAIGIYGKNDVTIKNIRIVDFGTGIEIADFITSSSDEFSFVESSSNTVMDSYFETRYWCIALRGVKSFVSGNTFIARNGNAVEFRTAETTFINNKFIDCVLSYWEFKDSNVLLGNTVNGKPLVFLEGQSNQVIDGAGMVTLINCTDMVIKNVDTSGLNNPTGFSYPISLFGINNSLITNCKGPITISGHDNVIFDNEFSRVGGAWQAAALMLSGSNNVVTQNSIVGINCCGLIVSGTSNYIEKNRVSSSSDSRLDNCAGITLGGSENYVYENELSVEEIGLNLCGEHNVLSQNYIVLHQGRYGLQLNGAMYNDILGNNLQGACEYAVWLSCSDFNNFVWNNFKDNTKVIEIHELVNWPTFTTSSYYAEYNRWDNGKEGNYWSDYKEQDNSANIFGKTPYKVYENFTDNHPRTKPYDISKIPVTFEKWSGSPNLYSPSDEGHVSKSFLLMLIGAVISIIVVVGIVLLWRYKNMPKHKG